ncbi:diaminopimelate decarboxylase [Microbacterium aquimaris]|uniref:diaminopimelate decarboxylase n=1 Tax=Microbacterium aquimaris TaxID=459816 RepID=UPI002AD248B8|nr:diaminopimelate decarboxylase [Microbacterium aquimaris]MDZ8274794.1 diaminopimelate decarboxylase [Microbacterium aquimaris]
MPVDAPSRPAPVLDHRPSTESVASRREQVVREVARRGLLTDTEPVCAVLDLDTIDELASSLRAAYPAEVTVLHTIAAKAIPLVGVLKHFQKMGLGCEVASPGELELALAAGFEPDRVIYDSPAKSNQDIAQALALGVRFNIDNFAELARVDRLIAEHRGEIPSIGLRINPQSGAGSIEAMSTATTTSKFGIGLADYREEIVRAFAERPWLRQLHVHSGSQGVALEHTATDVARVVDLADAIEAATGAQQVDTIDVGGGLSVNFASDETTPSFSDHADALRQAAPDLFSGKYEIATEFGRSLTAKAGTLLGRVEYVKQAGPRSVAVTHIGVHVAARSVFMPQSWPLRVEVFTPEGTRREGPSEVYDVAGPACFAGDLIATARTLPVIQPGDIIAVPDTGGYYVTNHFAYNSLPRPAIYARATVDGRRSFSLVRRAQTIADVVAESGEVDLVEITSESTDTLDGRITDAR